MPDKMVLAPNTPPTEAEPAPTQEGSRSSRSASSEGAAFCGKSDGSRDDPDEGPATASVHAEVIEGMPTQGEAPQGALMRVEDQALIHFETPKAALAKAQSVDDLRSIRDKVEAARAYAKQARVSLVMQIQSAELKGIADRCAGELWREMPRAVRSCNGQSHAATAGPPLADLGLIDSAVSA